MTFKSFIIPVLVLLCQYALAQNDSVYVMDEVIITDSQLRNFSSSQTVKNLNDSVISRNEPSLTSLLRYNSVLYFKENGLGMVSSASFRGTTASQTAVIWNGINVNSQLNGQTDFNAVNTSGFSSIAVRAGGGSVIYGSSAIGGSIHLSNAVSFNGGFNNEVKVDYGSFNTLGVRYNMTAAYNDFSVGLSLARNSSDNDYELPGYNLKNDNGQYYNTGINATIGYKINSLNTLRFYSYMFEGERHFSRTIVAPSKSKYNNVDTRNLVEWERKFGQFTSRTKVAYVTENYRYFENHERDNYEFGEVQSYIARYDITYELNNKLLLNAIADYTQNRAEGSGVSLQKRETGSASILMRHNVTNRLQYELGLRKEYTTIYDSPLLFSFGTTYDVANFYSLQLNASRNFRVPTFNDLYWEGSGNPDLKPETSYQTEIGNEFKYRGATLNLTGYYIKLTDMLRWVPGVSIWGPENVGKVNTYGLEALLNYKKSIGRSRVDLAVTYAYTESHEEGEAEQLIYVPYHKATAALAWSYTNFTAYYRHLFTGEVFSTSDNSSNIDPYNVSNIGMEYTLRFSNRLTVGAEVRNIWNEPFENVAMRPLPGRNYNMYINLKF